MAAGTDTTGPQLGTTLAHLVEGELEIEVRTDGARVRHAGMRCEVPYARVKRLFYGPEAGGGATFALEEADRAVRVRVRTASPRAIEVMDALVVAAAPLVAARCLAELLAGAELDLGALRLSADQLIVGEGAAARALPLHRLAGFEVRDGELLIDEHPEAPRRFAALPIACVANLDGLLYALGRLHPHADLRRAANAARVVELSAGECPSPLRCRTGLCRP